MKVEYNNVVTATPLYWSSIFAISTFSILYPYLVHACISCSLKTLSDCSWCVCMCAFQFGGTEGEWFQKLTARFCSHQSWALDQIKGRQKKDQRFNLFILVLCLCALTHIHIPLSHIRIHTHTHTHKILKNTPERFNRKTHMDALDGHAVTLCKQLPPN